MPFIKICGIYRIEDTEYVNKYRPDYFGMIINFKKSHRNVSGDLAKKIRAHISSDIRAVGVFVNEDTDLIEELLNDNIIDIVQLHGDEKEETIIRLRENTGKPVWKAFKIRNREEIEKAKASPADLILLDNGYGTGKTFDWSLIENIKRPFALAGGIDIRNMDEAIKRIHPYLIDISSGVETDGIKDPVKIREAIEKAHTIERS